MFKSRLKTILLLFTTLLTLSIIALVFAFVSFERDLNQRLEGKKFIQPTEYYASPLRFQAMMLYSQAQVEEILKQRDYRQRSIQQRLFPKDYLTGNLQECAERMQVEIPDNTACLGFSLPTEEGVTAEDLLDQNVQWILFQDGGGILATYKNIPAVPQNEVALSAPLLAQYIDTQPVMQKTAQLNEIPTSCLQAVMSIEDNRFLEHSGFSFLGLTRAVIKNVVLRKKAQGGSTITQQVVKNYFLTSEKTYRRKINELFLAILLESKLTKDQILEMYMNIIYMGQNGPFQVIGFPSAAKYYFEKNISELQLPECALLAAILNYPGGYDPFRRAEKALQRRELVLSKMKEQGYITEEDFNLSKSFPLPPKPKSMAAETAPYYIDAARKQVAKLEIPTEGVKIYTGLDLEAQDWAQSALQNHLAQLEKNNKKVKSEFEKGNSLEGLVLSASPSTGLIQVAVGGRSFRKTQFNRAVDSHRQVGSVMKPFVYLTALSTPQSKDPDKYFDPWTPTLDEKFEVRYEGQRWSPENYTKKFYGSVPLLLALTNSLNSATARLGQELGIQKVIETAQAVGLKSPMQSVPSVVLGSFEMYPIEVLQAYMTLSQLGETVQPSFVSKVVSNDGKILFQNQPQSQKVLDPTATSVLVGMMKEVLVTGSGKGVTLGGFQAPAAGKTGTTSDFKDAWFAGFTPYLTTIVWVGYDNNTSSGLTGASGPVPVWTEYMKKASASFPADDFPWNEELVSKKTIDIEQAQKFFSEQVSQDDPTAQESSSELWEELKKRPANKPLELILRN